MMIQIGVKTLHFHHEAIEEQEECYDCQHNKVHAGHFAQWSGVNDDCVICQQLSVSYLLPQILHIDVFVCHLSQKEAITDSKYYDATCSVNTLRGPPYMLV